MNVKIRQHDEFDCGAACLASVAAHYKLGIPIARIRQYAATGKDGTSVYGLIRAASKLGFVAKGVKGKKESLSMIPYPTVAHVIKETTEDIYHHFVVLYKSKKNKIQVMDPAYGSLEWMNIEEFVKVWSGVLILFEPTETFYPHDERYPLFGRFKELIAPHKVMLLQAFIGALCYTIFGLSNSIYIEKITDYVLIGGNTGLLNLLSFAMIFVVVMKLIFYFVHNFIIIRTCQLMDSSLILGYYKHILKLPQQFFDMMQIGEITSRINDAVKIRNFINSTIIGLVVNALIVILSFVVMFVYSWKLALVMTIVIPFYLILYFFTDFWNKRVERKVMENSANLESQLIESLNAEKTIKQFGIENYENERTENRFVKMLYSIYSSGKCALISNGVSEFFSSILVIVLIWIGSTFVMKGEMTTGELMSFYAIVGYFTAPISSLIMANKTIREAFIAADRLFEIMDLEREKTEDKIELKRDMIGDVVFSNVKFAYANDKNVFENLNLRIQKGKLSAIVGESGCGKTTIVNLLQNLYPLNNGKITIGGCQLSLFSNESIRTMISVVPQQITLFSGTILQNIALGEYYPDVRRVSEILDQLGLSEYIESLPQGFNSQVGENGSYLSGGQKQRLSIARAIYKNPEILIMDEATSSLDSLSERYVQSVVEDLLKQKKTIVVVAHRLSTIKNADEIFVLKDGALIEQGNFSKLVSNNGEFYRLWSSQKL